MITRGLELVARRDESRSRIARRYDRLDVLGRGATGTVYRAYDRLHRRLVALKSSLLEIEPAGDDPLSSQPIRSGGLLAREFVLLAGLRHPNVVACMDYGLDASERPFCTMDLQRDALPLREFARDLPLGAKVDLLVQLLHALAYVHRRGLVHRDVKPDNVLATRGVVKLIDFGLATAAGTVASSPVGTLAYSAPEVVRCAPADASADLFAVGVIAYELCAGRHPFDTRSSAALLQGLFRGEIDWAPIEPRMAPVVRRLLARSPAERFASALDVVAAMTEAAARSLPLETVSTREAFLQGTELVGRDAELERLARAIPPREGTGGAIVVTGESGVGKSRLLEELGVRAMTRGVRVLRGQSLESGGRPYEPWRAVLRALALLGQPTPLEESVIAGVVPDVAIVLERAIDGAPELDSEATHLRVVRVLDALLRRFPEPLLVVLEDVQWAGAESLALFARVRSLAAELPIAIVASFRGDASALPEELGRAEIMALERLSPASVSRLCATTIGGPRGERLAELVFEQSRGNAFAVLEVVRTLAGEAGGLERVTDLDAPERALAGRVERLLDRRVERLSENDRAVLRSAAIAGRELDLELLAAIHAGVDIAASAARAVDAAVLASVQGRFWFAHDKLRDAVVEAITDEERRRLHGEVAEALLRIAPDDAATLAHHFRAAGDRSREGEHAAKAGDQFLRSGAYRDAIPHLERAIELLGAPGGPRLVRARLERQLGESLFRCGKLPDAKRTLASALVALGRPLPASKLDLARAMVVEASAQAALRARRSATRGHADPSLEESILVYTQLSRLAHHLNDEPLVLYVTLSALNLAERGGARLHRARLSAVFGAVMGLAPVHRWARFYFRVARELGARVEDDSLRAFILAHEGYYEAGIGAWDACARHLEESIELYDRIGDVRLAEESVSILAYATFYKGERARSLELYERLERSGAERGDTQIVSWGVTNRIKLMIASGRMDAIDDALLARAEALLVDGITKAVHDGVVVELALARGDLAAARRAAEAGVARLEKSPPRSFMACSTYASMADALLACAAKNPRDRALRARAEKAVRALASVARVFPIAEPARLRAAGVLESLGGRRAKARALLERAAELAAEREQPADEARSRAALAAL